LRDQAGTQSTYELELARKTGRARRSRADCPFRQQAVRCTGPGLFPLARFAHKRRDDVRKKGIASLARVAVTAAIAAPNPACSSDRRRIRVTCSLPVSF